MKPAFSMLCSLALLQACGGTPTFEVAVQLDTRTCEGEETLAQTGAHALRVRLYGPGIDTAASLVDAPLADETLVLPAVPMTQGVRLLVELVREPGALVIGRGLSEPLVLDATDRTAAVTVFLRKTGRFSPAGRAGATVCAALKTPRWGHSATRLSDGRVLIAGGVSASGEVLATSEIFDPATGALEPGPRLAVGRAHHAAAALPDMEQVVLVGGESDTDGTPLGSAEIFDEKTGSFQLVPMKGSRRRMVALGLEKTVFVAGGQGADGAFLATTEIYDPATRSFVEGPELSAARAWPALARDGDSVWIVGGLGEDGALDSTERVTLVEGFPAESVAGPALLQPRWAPVLSLLAGQGWVVAGGVTGTLEAPEPLADVEQLSIGADSWSDVDVQLPSAVENGCVTPLADGTVMRAGGALQTAQGRTVSPEASLLYVSSGGEERLAARTLGAAKTAREHAACVLLRDGNVLLTGGRDEQGTPVGRVELFVPLYRASAETPFAP